ncbi:hypothetical protein [Fodinibius sediminis]|uniref:Nitrogen regulatory protein P-II family n=1 Tax=Fodinibius sediminis TaxID=1214077 RepID=A0A521C6X5_9BACT|nr:hypothetical protein [Fodinibius sediminis]SMO55115.1 hypothetical protein SAMN06265218_105105 [Fodinibius sediminis]
MKLLIILSIEEYTDDVRKILARQKVPIYSETNIHGFRTEAYQPDISNWFAGDDHGVYSTLFFAIQGEECVKRVIAEVKAYNEDTGASEQNPLHAYQLNVEESV